MTTIQTQILEYLANCTEDWGNVELGCGFDVCIEEIMTTIGAIPNGKMPVNEIDRLIPKLNSDDYKAVDLAEDLQQIIDEWHACQSGDMPYRWDCVDTSVE